LPMSTLTKRKRPKGAEEPEDIIVLACNQDWESLPLTKVVMVYLPQLPKDLLSIVLLYLIESLLSLQSQLKAKNSNDKKRALLILTNYVRKDGLQALELLQANSFFPLFAQCLGNDTNSCHVQATKVIEAVSEIGSIPHLRLITDQSVMSPLCFGLRNPDLGQIHRILGIFETLLRKQNQIQKPRIADMIEELGGLDLIEQLQRHPDADIYDRVVKLLQDYYGSEMDHADDIQTFAATDPVEMVGDEEVYK